MSRLSPRSTARSPQGPTRLPRERTPPLRKLRRTHQSSPTRALPQRRSPKGNATSAAAARSVSKACRFRQLCESDGGRRSCGKVFLPFLSGAYRSRFAMGDRVSQGLSVCKAGSPSRHSSARLLAHARFRWHCSGGGGPYRPRVVRAGKCARQRPPTPERRLVAYARTLNRIGVMPTRRIRRGGQKECGGVDGGVTLPYRGDREDSES